MSASSIGSPRSNASASTASRREPTSVTSQPWPKSRISARVYSRATVASVPSTETSVICEAAQAGLIAGTVPTKGSEKRCRKSVQHQGRGGVAGDHDQIRRMRIDQIVHHRDHAL